MSPAHRGDRLYVDGRAVASGHEMLADAGTTIELHPVDPAAIHGPRTLIRWARGRR